MKLIKRVSKKPKRNMAQITKILRQVRSSRKEGKRKSTLMEKQIITLTEQERITDKETELQKG